MLRTIKLFTRNFLNGFFFLCDARHSLLTIWCDCDEWTNEFHFICATFHLRGVQSSEFSSYPILFSIIQTRNRLQGWETIICLDENVEFTKFYACHAFVWEPSSYIPPCLRCIHWDIQQRVCLRIINAGNA